MSARKSRRGGYILDPFRGEKRVLYAVAVELWNGKQWDADIHYVHAHTDKEAKRIFLNTQPGIGRFVAVAPAVGFYARDEHGDHLSADAVDTRSAAALNDELEGAA